ncbi:nca-2 [Pristionchus pacificus]|uniref:Nca-2 n=1 Tax=Pristionchus pacificus TaxID=54126 RepID=A0A2A6C9A6_PRIPA|nr:nca-2 [Pristionchus pacificus]|eukprot:PDM74686.1 nca-2 [Pristionchus pacificus]
MSSATTRLLACKAAALSSAMLTRRKSSSQPGGGETGGGTAGSRGESGGSKVARRARESIVAITEMINLDPNSMKKKKASELLEWSTWRDILRFACLCSMLSCCLHTPQTLSRWPPLHFFILTTDFVVTAIFTIDAIAIMRHQGNWQSSNLIGDRWARFDLFMLAMHYLSVGLHLLELFALFWPEAGVKYEPYYGIIRSPRPFVMIRFIRSVLQFKLPKNRIKQIIKRSSQQIQNVTIFFTFFMALYAIMGVQLFGRMDYHCVLPGTDPKNVTIKDLAIPDTMCSQKGEVIQAGGYECPDTMQCVKLDMTAHAEGFYGMFNDFVHSLFTVYMAASQEGWVYVLYDCLDTFPSWVCFLYFVTLIFFLAWLVKNVFIAVITETFAEVRVQFNEIWQTREATAEEDFSMKLEKTSSGWRLIEVDDYVLHGRSPKIFHWIVTSTLYQTTMMILVLFNATFHATFVYRHDGTDQHRRSIYYFVEVGFTILFNVETIMKIVGHSWRTYWKRGNDFLSKKLFAEIKVFRIVRLIKASPMLEDFIYKIFGPGKKLGGLVIFTMMLLIVTSAISLQLFCWVPTLNKFTTFPQAFMSMFQIITQEGWTDVVVEILRTTHENFVPFVAIYFVGYHLLVTLIVLSLFVAVILDNLEMDEELKKIKQLKAREQNTVRTTLPWRLRIFDHFPTRPQMISFKRMTSEFPCPKIRHSFTRCFAEDDEATFVEESGVRENGRLLLRQGTISRKQNEMRIRHIGQLSSKNIISNLIDDSNRSRALLSDSTQFIAQFTRSGTMKGGQHRSRNRGLVSSLKGKHILESLKENGDCRNDDVAPKERKEGDIDIKALQQKRAHAEITRNRIEEEMRENHPMFDRPLFAVGRESRLRQFCRAIVYAKYTPNRTDPTTGKAIQIKYKQLHELFGLMTYLDWTMVIMTSLSCCSMLFESPWPSGGENLIFNNVYLQIADYFFVLAMTVELLVKILADGMFFTPKAVVRDVGGIMTIFIYMTSLIYLAWMPRHVEINSPAQLLMIFRAMRPLRIYTLVPHIRRVVVELCRGFKEILLVTILLVVLMFIFASFGVQIAGGKLAACNDPSILIRENCSGVFEQRLFVTRMEVHGKNDDEAHPKILVPRVWTNPRNFNFDHIGFAMLALFETLSYKGWNVVRDILYLRQGPWAVLYLHVYVFMGCMIGLTLFVGVVIANYTENRGTALLTVDQRRWHDLKARLKMAQPLHVPPKPSESAKIRSRLYELTLSKAFKQSFFFLVMINSTTLFIPWALEEEKERARALFGLTVLSAVCCVLFTIEILLKAVAFTPNGFWQSRRNRGDCLITLLGLAWILLHFVLKVPVDFTTNFKSREWRRFTYTFGYLVVILRFFTIAGRKSTLKMLMLTVLMSMVRSLFIIAAMFLLVLFYANTGVILFGMVKYGQAVSKHVNFRNGRQALVVLFRSVTGEDWNDIMHDCMRSPPFCFWTEGVNYWQTDCGNYFGAIVYFCSFYLIITYIVLNLLVAIIMENFSLFYSSEEDALLSYADIRNFQQVWNIVDREQKRSIPIRRVKFLLRLLKGRLEVDPHKDRLLFKHMCHEMSRLHNGEDVSFHDVLNMLSYRSVDIRKSLQLEELLHREELEYLIEEEVAKYTIRTWLESCLKRIKSKQKNTAASSSEQTMLGPTLAIHRASTVGLPKATSSTLISRVSPDTQSSSLLSAANRTQSMESSDDEGATAAESRRSSRACRRGSIPELVGEAKKFMLGVGKRRSEDRGNNNSAHATSNNNNNSNPNLTARDRRTAMRNFQIKTCELPELEESSLGEDSPSYDRRHSYDQQLMANSNTLDLAAASLSSISVDPVPSSGTSPLEWKVIDQSPDVNTWWSEIAGSS